MEDSDDDLQFNEDLNVEENRFEFEDEDSIELKVYLVTLFQVYILKGRRRRI